VNKRFALAGVVAALAIAGCGSSGPSLSSFKSGYQKQKAQFTSLGTDLGTAITSAQSKTDAQIATEFSALSSRTSQTALQLQKLNPPSKYKQQLNALIGDFNVVAADLASIASAGTAHNASAAKSAAEKLVSDAAKVKAADRSLTASLGLPQSS
jgi:hypothetical protein